MSLRSLLPSEGELAVEKCLRAYRDAIGWRREVSRELSSVSLTFAQWLALHTTAELIRETRDAVSQVAIAKRSGVDQMTVSAVMKKLAERSLVSVGPDFQWPAYRIWLTERGERATREGASRVAAASVGWLARGPRPATGYGKISRSR